MLLCLMGEGGTPSSPGQGWEWYPIQSWPGGTPSSPGWGVPHPVLGQGVPPSRPGMGYLPTPSRPGMGYPLSARWGTPHPYLVWGTPSQEGWGTPLPVSWMGYPPPLPKVEQTHTCENITSRRTTYAGGNNICIYIFFFHVNVGEELDTKNTAFFPVAKDLSFVLTLVPRRCTGWTRLIRSDL